MDPELRDILAPEELEEVLAWERRRQMLWSTTFGRHILDQEDALDAEFARKPPVEHDWVQGKKGGMYRILPSGKKQYKKGGGVGAGTAPADGGKPDAKPAAPADTKSAAEHLAHADQKDLEAKRAKGLAMQHTERADKARDSGRSQESRTHRDMAAKAMATHEAAKAEADASRQKAAAASAPPPSAPKAEAARAAQADAAPRRKLNKDTHEQRASGLRAVADAASTGHASQSDIESATRHHFSGLTAGEKIKLAQAHGLHAKTGGAAEEGAVAHMRMLHNQGVRGQGRYASKTDADEKKIQAAKKHVDRAKKAGFSWEDE